MANPTFKVANSAFTRLAVGRFARRWARLGAPRALAEGLAERSGVRSGGWTDWTSGAADGSDQPKKAMRAGCLRTGAGIQTRRLLLQTDDALEPHQHFGVVNVAAAVLSETSGILNNGPDTSRLFWHQRARKWRLRTTALLASQWGKSSTCCTRTRRTSSG